MDDLLLHPRTAMELHALAADPPHAVLLIAPTGTGKRTVAYAWAAKITQKTAIGVLEPDEKGTITIEATRQLYQKTRSKQPGHQVVIIDHAEAMSIEAQNAFLKLLEEPRPNLTFILTATSAEAVLPTILSRVHCVQILPVAAAQLSAYALKTAQSDPQTLAQVLFVAAGRPATLVTLLQDPQSFETHKDLMRTAKQLLEASSYERLAKVQELSKDRAATVAILEAMTHMLERHIAKQPSPQLLTFADLLQECLRRLRQNGNIRAQLTQLFAA